MRHWPIWLIMCVAVSGCEGTAAPGGTASGTAGQVDGTVAGSPPATISEGFLALYPDLDKNDKITLGKQITPTEVDGLFKVPKNHLPTNTLPKVLSADDYSAIGWESNDGTQGAGFITDAHTHKLLSAILRQSAASVEDAAAIVKFYTEKTPDIKYTTQTFGEDRYRYWFWDDGDNRLMILEAPGKGDRVQLTLALGVQQVLKALRADPADVKLDGVKAVAETRPDATKGAPSGS